MLSSFRAHLPCLHPCPVSKKVCQVANVCWDWAGWLVVIYQHPALRQIKLIKVSWASWIDSQPSSTPAYTFVSFLPCFSFESFLSAVGFAWFSPHATQLKKKRRTGILCSSPNLTLTPVILWWFFQVQLHVWDLLPVGKDLFHRIPEVLQTGMGCSSCAAAEPNEVRGRGGNVAFCC